MKVYICEYKEKDGEPSLQIRKNHPLDSRFRLRIYRGPTNEGRLIRFCEVEIDPNSWKIMIPPNT